MRPIWYKEIVDKYEEKKLSVTFEGGGNRMSFLESQSFFHAWLCQWTFVSCWHINDVESAAMWRLYAVTSQAVALQSTYERLRGCLPDAIFTGQIQYLDYEAGVIPESNTMWPFVHKRMSFSHEQELRALIQNLPVEDDSIAVGKVNPEKGEPIPVELERLIEKVYVGPSAPAWYADLARKVISRHGLPIDVVQSALDASPIY